MCAHTFSSVGVTLCRQGDSALLLPSNQQVIHECLVEHVGKEKIVLKITDKAKQARSESSITRVQYQSWLVNLQCCKSVQSVC